MRRRMLLPALVLAFVPSGAEAQDPRCAGTRMQIEEFARTMRGAGAVVDDITDGLPTVSQGDGLIRMNMRHPTARREVDAAIRFLNDHRPENTLQDIERLANTALIPALNRIRAIDAAGDVMRNAELIVAINAWSYAANLRGYWALGCAPAGDVRCGRLHPRRRGRSGRASRILRPRKSLPV